MARHMAMAPCHPPVVFFCILGRSPRYLPAALIMLSSFNNTASYGIE